MTRSGSTPGSGLPAGAVAPTLTDLQRALCRDRSHVVVAAPESAERSVLLEALPDHLAGWLRAVRVRLADVPAEAVASSLLRRLQPAAAPGPGVVPDATERLVELGRRLAREGKGLLVVVEDAEELSAASLGALGRLARACEGLRVALFAAPTRGEPFARVVSGLGLGAQKVELPTRPLAGSDPEASSRPARPERVEPAASRQGIRISRPHGAGGRRGRLAATLALGTGALGIAIAAWSGHGDSLSAHGVPSVATPRTLGDPLPGLPLRLLAGWMAPPRPAPAPSAQAALGAAPPHVALPPPALESTSVRLPPGLETPKRGPHPAARPPRESAPAGRPAASPGSKTAIREEPKEEPLASHPIPKTMAAREPDGPPPSPRPTVVVSINARPWARIEVDGREIGITPLGSVPLRAGPHRFRAHLPDGEIVERTLEVDARRSHFAFP